MHLSHSFRIESGSRLITASRSGTALRTSSSTLAAASRPHERSRHPITAASRPHERSRHPITADIRTHRRRATALCHNPVRGAQRSVPGLGTPLLSACRRYATTPEAEYDRASGLAFSQPPTASGAHASTQMRRGAPPLVHSCYQSTAAPPCGAYRPLSPTPDAVRG